MTDNQCLPKWRRRRSYEHIEFIVVHYTASPGCSAYSIKHYFEKTTKQKSTHYIVDDNGWLPFLPVNQAAFHCGGKSGSMCGAYNGNSIGIDICDNKADKKTCSSADSDWFFTDETLEQAKNLIVNLMIQHNIDINHVVRHYDVTGKLCPRPFVGNTKSYNHDCTCFTLWDRFKAEVFELYKVKKGICASLCQ